MPADALGEDYSPNATNVRFRFGEATGCPGRGQFDTAPVAQQAQVIGNFSLSNTFIWPFMLTTSKLYRRGNATPGTPAAWSETTGTLVPTGTRRWTYTVGEDRLFFNRGSDTLLYWDGVGANQFKQVSNDAGFQGIGGGATAPAARFVRYFNNRVVVLFTIENGTTFANRIRWSESGNYKHWDETLGLGAGFLDLWSEGAESINGAEVLGERLIIYRRHSISELVATGVTSPVHQEQVRVHGNGCVAPYTIASNGQVHFFLAEDKNVYAWDGVNLTAIGNNIQNELRTIIHEDAYDSYFGFVANDRQEYWLVLSDPSRLTFDAFVFDYLRIYWIKETFPDLFSAAEIVVPMNTPTWTTIIGTWLQQTEAWIELSGTSKTLIVGGRTDSATMQISEAFLGDFYSFANAIDKVIETDDIYLPDPWTLQQGVRLLIIYDYINTRPFEVSVSNTHGISWRVFNINPNPLGYSFVDFRVTGNVIRFRFRSNTSDGQFGWRGYIYEYIESGEFIGTVQA